MQISLVGRSPLVRAWQHAFDGVDDVCVIEGDYFAHPADAMVSPANSFGVMDGGIDAAIRDVLGFEVQRRLQKKIVADWHGELPVGVAEIVPTDHAKWPNLIAAPTMRVPEGVGRTLHAFLAFRAVLAMAKRHSLSSLVCCGLATGIGAMSPTRCALQMRVAYNEVSAPARIPSWERIHKTHEALKRS